MRVLHYFEDGFYTMKPKILTNAQFQRMKLHKEGQKPALETKKDFQSILQKALNNRLSSGKGD